VLCAAFDAATDEAVYAVRDAVRANGITLPDRPPHRPHFSMAAAVVTPRAELDAVVQVAAEVAARHEPVALRFDEVGRFGRAGVVWLGPRAPVSALSALQRDADTSLQAAGWPRAFGDRSSPAGWVPHCTLATRVPTPKLREVQEAVQARYRPIDATVDAVAVILVGGRGDIAHVACRRRTGGSG
jgi:2'-5' RNA ligase